MWTIRPRACSQTTATAESEENMDDNALHIRTAHLSDAPALRAIYAPYVEKTAITFEYTVPDVEEFAARMRATLCRYPYLVAERGGEPRRLCLRRAVRQPCCLCLGGGDEHLPARGPAAPGHRQAAVRRARGGAARAECSESLCLHRLSGRGGRCAPDEKTARSFTHTSATGSSGEFSRCGYKFGTWYSMAWMEKCIGAHEESPAPVRPFPEISPAELESIFGSCIKKRTVSKSETVRIFIAFAAVHTRPAASALPRRA